jgi:hypothetical protein
MNDTVQYKLLWWGCLSESRWFGREEPIASRPLLSCTTVYCTMPGCSLLGQFIDILGAWKRGIGWVGMWAVGCGLCRRKMSFGMKTERGEVSVGGAADGQTMK